MKLETFGDFPPALYRAFDKREYAEAFVNGKVRFGLASHYSEIEDVERSDLSEGIGSIIAPGTVIKVTMNHDGQVTRQWEEAGHVHHTVIFGNAIYVLSLSYPTDSDLSLLRKKFGPYVVKVEKPRVFSQDLTNALANGPTDTANVIECVRVLYNKGETSAATRSTCAPSTVVWTKAGRICLRARVSAGTYFTTTCIRG